MFKSKGNYLGSTITFLSVFIGVIIGLSTKSFHKLGYIIEDHLKYNKAQINDINLDRFLKPFDLSIYLVVILLIILFIYMLQRDKMNSLKKDARNEIDNLENHVKQIGGTLVYQMGHALDLSTEHILSKLCKMAVENSKIVVSCSAYSYVESHNKSKATFIVDNLAHYTLFNTRSNVIAREIYEFDKNYYKDYIKVHNIDEKLRNMILTDIANYFELDSPEHITQYHIDKIISTHENLDRIYSESTDKYQGDLFKKSLRLYETLLKEIQDKSTANEIKKDFCSKCLLSDDEKLKASIPEENSLIDNSLNLSCRKATLRSMLNAVVLFASSEIGGNGLNDHLEYELRRVQRSGIMTAILLNDVFYTSHNGKGDKKGRIYYFQPVIINQKQIVITASINSEVLTEIEKTGNVLDYISYTATTINESINYLASKYNLDVKSLNK